jgi:hypothetical protein
VTIVVVDGDLRRAVRAFPFAETVAWSPSGELLALQMPDAVEVWDAVRGRVVARVPAHTPAGLVANAIRWTPGGRSLLVDAQSRRDHD